MSTKNKKESSLKFKHRTSNKGAIDNSRKDRRSGDERRKAQSNKYFIDGGVERRSWAERRNLWYLTM